jgi:hypothetical protein
VKGRGTRACVVTQTNSVQLRQSAVQRPIHYIHSADFKALSCVKFRLFLCTRISETIRSTDCRKCGGMALINGQLMSRVRGSVTNNKGLLIELLDLSTLLL